MHEKGLVDQQGPHNANQQTNGYLLKDGMLSPAHLAAKLQKSSVK